eukprot:3939026-Rhodomonas_salina.2
MVASGSTFESSSARCTLRSARLASTASSAMPRSSPPHARALNPVNDHRRCCHASLCWQLHDCVCPSANQENQRRTGFNYYARGRLRRQGQDH